MPNFPRLYKLRDKEGDFNLYASSFFPIMELEIPMPPSIPMDYVFTKGTEELFGYYSVTESAGASLIAQSLTSQAYSAQDKLVRLSDGTLYVVYKKELVIDGYRRQIYVKKSVDNGVTWTDETRISTYSGMENQHQNHPSIAVDGSDCLHVVWNGMATGFSYAEQLWYAKYDGEWSTPIRISTYSNMANDLQCWASIAVDGLNYLHVVWRGGATGYTKYQIWYVKYDGTWSTPIRISTYNGMENYFQSIPSIAIDSNNCLHVVWSGSATGYVNWTQVWYVKYDAGWSIPLRISTYSGMENGHQGLPCIAVDFADCLGVVWCGLLTSTLPYLYQIWYAKYNGGWSTPIRISTAEGMENYSQENTTIGFDTSNNIYVLWQGRATGYIYDEKIWYTHCAGAWSTPECLQPLDRNTYPNLRYSRLP